MYKRGLNVPKQSDEPRNSGPILWDLWRKEISRQMIEEYKGWRILSNLRNQNESDGSHSSTDSKTKRSDYIKISKRRIKRTPSGKK